MNKMRLLPLLLSFACLAEEPVELTSQVTEIPGDQEGVVDLRMESIYRGETRVMMIMSRRNADDQLAVVSRTYLSGGALRMTESDENGDGFLETVTFHAPDPNDIEVFKRQEDGSVKPVSTAALNIHKKMFELQAEAEPEVEQTLRDFLAGRIDQDGIAVRARDVREKGEQLKQELLELEEKEQEN